MLLELEPLALPGTCSAAPKRQACSPGSKPSPQSAGRCRPKIQAADQVMHLAVAERPAAAAIPHIQGTRLVGIPFGLDFGFDYPCVFQRPAVPRQSAC